MFDEILVSRDILAIVITVILFLLVGYRPPWWSGKCEKSIKDIPGPFAVPLFGTRWMYWFGGYSFSKLHEVYKDMFRRHGPIVKEETLFNIPVTI